MFAPYDKDLDKCRMNVAVFYRWQQLNRRFWPCWQLMILLTCACFGKLFHKTVSVLIQVQHLLLVIKACTSFSPVSMHVRRRLLLRQWVKLLLIQWHPSSKSHIFNLLQKISQLLWGLKHFFKIMSSPKM